MPGLQAGAKVNMMQVCWHPDDLVAWALHKLSIKIIRRTASLQHVLACMAFVHKLDVWCDAETAAQPNKGQHRALIGQGQVRQGGPGAKQL